MSTEVASSSASAPKKKKSASALTPGTAGSKSTEPLEGSGGRKSKGEESNKSGKSGKAEIEGDKKHRKGKGEDGKSNGHGSSELGVGDSGKPPKVSKKASKRLPVVEPEESSSEEKAPVKPAKPSKPSKPVAAPVAVDSSSSDSEDHSPKAKAPAVSSKKPVVPPKPAKATSPAASPKPASRKPAAAPVKEEESDDSATSTTATSEEVAARKVPKERGSCEASTLSSSDDSSSENVPAKATSSSATKPSASTTASGKKPTTSTTQQATSDKKPKTKPSIDETSDSPSPDPEDLSTESPAPSTSSLEPKSNKATGGGGGGGSGRAPRPVSANQTSSGSVPIASSSNQKDHHDKDKKHKGFFGFLKKSKKHKDGSSGGIKDSGAKDHHKDGTPEKRRTEEEKKTYVVSSVSDLPEDIQKKLKKSHIDETALNKHFYILCNVLHFLTKHSFRIPEQDREVRERRPYASQAMMDAAKEILETTDNVKKFYKNIEFSGKGGFGRVFAAKDLATKKRVAIKKLPHASDKDKKNNYCEISFLSTCNHPNIVKFNRAWEFDDKQEVWIVTEFLEGGTLSEAVKVHQFTERHIAYVAREILKALKYLHSLGYIHRDLKSGNVMMSIEGQIKLIDFGLCCDTADGDRLQMLGSPYWIPPEMIKKKRHGCPADIWSFAVCVLEMYLKEPPHSDSRLYAMFTAASVGLTSAIPSRASDTARDFLSKCLEINPSKRWTAEQLLTHPFVTAPKLEEGIRDVLRGVFVSNSLALSGI